MPGQDFQITDEIWVNTTEAAAAMGYHNQYVQRLARENWALPEDERLIRVRRRSNRYDIWLPDLLKYSHAPRRGPQPPRKKSDA